MIYTGHQHCFPPFPTFRPMSQDGPRLRLRPVEEQLGQQRRVEDHVRVADGDLTGPGPGGPGPGHRWNWHQNMGKLLLLWFQRFNPSEKYESSGMISHPIYWWFGCHFPNIYW